MSVQGCGPGANLLPDPNNGSEIANVHGGGGGGGGSRSSFGGSNTTISSSTSSANIIVTGVDGGGCVGGGSGMGGRRSATPSLSAVAVQPDGSSTHSAQSKASTESLQ